MSERDFTTAVRKIRELFRTAGSGDGGHTRHRDLICDGMMLVAARAKSAAEAETTRQKVLKILFELLLDELRELDFSHANAGGQDGVREAEDGTTCVEEVGVESRTD